MLSCIAFWNPPPPLPKERNIILMIVIVIIMGVKSASGIYSSGGCGIVQWMDHPPPTPPCR